MAVLTIGPVGNVAARAVKRAAAEGVSAAHYDLRFARPLDEELLDEVGRRFERVVTVEDGVVAGRRGERRARLFRPARLPYAGTFARYSRRPVVEHGTPGGAVCAVRIRRGGNPAGDFGALSRDRSDRKRGRQLPIPAFRHCGALQEPQPVERIAAPFGQPHDVTQRVAPDAGLPREDLQAQRCGAAHERPLVLIVQFQDAVIGVEENEVFHPQPSAPLRSPACRHDVCRCPVRMSMPARSISTFPSARSV